MADPKRVDAGSSGLAGVASILDLLGGQKQTSTTKSDTGALSGILQNLQSTNYDNVLQSIFTQAGGQIPGLTAGLSNSIGARTGGNSAVTAALGKLLESTAMKAAGQTAQLQQGNQALQLQAAQGIAGGNKSTTQTSGTNTGKAAKNLAILQLGSKLLGSETGKGLLTKGKTAFDELFAGTGSASSELGSSIGGGFGNDGLGDAAASFGQGSISGDILNQGIGGFDSSSLFDFGGDAVSSFADAGSFDFGDAIGDAAASYGSDAGSSLFELFADGGLVGRDGKKEEEIDYPMGGKVKGPSNAAGTPQAYADGGRVEPKVGTKGPQKSGGTGGGMSSESVKDANSPKAVVIVLDQSTLDSGINPRKTLARREEKAGTYADGGEVRSGGGRVSSRPGFDVNNPTANTAVQSPRAALNPQGSRRDMVERFPGFEQQFGEANAMSSQSIDSINPAESAAVGNAIGNAVGHAVMSSVVGPIGMMGLSATKSLTGITPPQSAMSQAIAAISQALGIGAPAANPVGTVTASQMSFNPDVGVGDASNSGDANSSSTGSGADAAGGIGGSGDGSGGIGSTAGSGNSGGDDGAASAGDFANGGTIRGPGTGTSDSIPIKASVGEYIMPADVVQTLGVRFFDEMKNHFHTPAAVQHGK